MLAMTRSEADAKAKELLGYCGVAFRVSSNDRNQRFGVLLSGNMSIRIMGYGSSYEAALQMVVETLEKDKANEQDRRPEGGEGPGVVDQ